VLLFGTINSYSLVGRCKGTKIERCCAWNAIIAKIALFF